MLKKPLILLVCTTLNLLQSPTVCFAYSSPEFIPPHVTAYMQEMRTRFYRNLGPSTLLTSPVTLRFFLTSEGSIRDITVEKSSGSQDQDLACVDAVYCASPLSRPPQFRGALRPPPAGDMAPPDFYGPGIYTFTFNASPKLKDGVQSTEQSFQFLLIPREVLFRYPGLFKPSELEQPSNKVKVEAKRLNKSLLENARFQWSKFYIDTAHSTRPKIQNWAKTIDDFYLKGQPADWY